MKIALKYIDPKRLIRWGMCVIGVVLVIALISWLTVPSYVKNTLEQQVAVETGRKLTITDVAFNPFTLTIEFSGVTLLDANKKAPDFSVDEFILKISPTSLFHFAPVVREVTLKYPYLKLVRMQHDGKEENNFSDVVARLAAHPSKGKPLQYYVANIQLIDGAIHLDDQVVGKEIHIEAINLALPFFSNFTKSADKFIEPKLSAKVDGTPFELVCRSKPFLDTRETSLAIDFDHLDLAPLLAFSPKPLPFKVNSAKISSQLSLNFLMEKNVANVTLSGAANLTNVDLSDFSGAPLLKTKLIHIGLREANLTTEKFGINTIVIDEPEVWVGLNNNGKLNWISEHQKQTSHVENPKATTAKPTASATPVINLLHFKVKDGTFHWSDAANATPTMDTQLHKISIVAQHVSTNDKAAPGKLDITIGQEHHQQASFAGSFHPAHGAVAGHIAVSNVALATYQPYFNRFLAANTSGTLSLKTQLAVMDGKVRLTEFSGTLENLKLQANQQGNKKEVGGSSVIVARKIAVENASMDSVTKLVKIEKVALNRVQGDIFRDTDGTVNLIRYLKNDTKTGNVNKGKPDADKSTEKSTKSTKASVWQTMISQIAMSESSFVFGDKSKSPAVNIRADNLEAKIEQISSKFEQPIKMTLSANLNASNKSSGKIVMDGSATAKSAQLNIDLQNFSVVALQPYFTDFLNITLEKGAVSTKGQLAWIAPAELNYQGTLGLDNFSSSDKASSDSFLRLKNLAIAGIDIGLGAKQPKITLGKISLSDFYARAILSEQGKLNLENILVHEKVQTKSDPKTAATSSTKAAPAKPTISVGQVNLNNGVINYTDNFVKPHFSMRMTGMSGTVGTIQSTLGKAAPINLKGKIDNDAPIAISGSLNPLFDPMLLDIKMTATGINLPRLTTYSAKYAGYPIERGKLSLDVEYHVKDKKLTANNTLKIDQLTFGKKVESPDATKLPVLLLVDLLTDSSGKINLDVPISGTLDDPEFSVGGVIMKVVLNILAKVITSPFSLLAHSFAGGGELSYVEFASGSAKLTDDTKTKLDNLAKALAEHPNLKLDIIGRADMAADTPGLRERKLNRQIKKVSAMNEDDTSPAVLSDKDKERALWKIYSNAKFDKPSNLIGLAKVQPAADMERMILENTPISEDDLNSLATRRAAVVRNYLTDVAHVPAERMYNNAPKLSGDDIKDKGVLSRVDFNLSSM